MSLSRNPPLPLCQEEFVASQKCHLQLKSGCWPSVGWWLWQGVTSFDVWGWEQVERGELGSGGHGYDWRLHNRTASPWCDTNTRGRTGNGVWWSLSPSVSHFYLVLCSICEAPQIELFWLFSTGLITLVMSPMTLSYRSTAPSSVHNSYRGGAKKEYQWTCDLSTSDQQQ